MTDDDGPHLEGNANGDGGGGGGDGGYVGGARFPDETTAAAAAVAAEREDQTTALVATCSAMLALALALRLLSVCWLKRRLAQRGVNAAGAPAPLVVCGMPARALQRALDVSVYVVLWYGISIGMTLFNKWFLRVWADGGYPFATSMTCVNMLTKCVLSRILDRCSARRMAPLPRAVYWKLAVPIGLATSLDIMLSNLSFFYITVTFYTIVKSGANVWNLLFSICLGHQRASYALCGVILLISSGIALASYGSTQFVLHGFLLVLTASVCGTLRWVLTQSLLTEMEPSSNRILAVVYYISPASALGLLPIALVSDAQDMMRSKFVHDTTLLLQSAGFILVSGALAFALIFVEILLVQKTSALSLGIAGSFKDVTQVVLAVFIFGDRLSPINVFGLVVATCGMLLYTFLKHGEPEQAGKAQHYHHQPQPQQQHKQLNQQHPHPKQKQEYMRVPTQSELESGEWTEDPGALSDRVIGDEEEDGKPRRRRTMEEEPLVVDLPELKSGSNATELTRRESKEYHDDAILVGSAAQHV